MITKEKINIYLKFSGDIDAFAQFGTEKEVMDDSDWGEINDLVQNIYLINQNLVSVEIKTKVEAKLKTLDAYVQNAIISLANNL